MGIVEGSHTRPDGPCYHSECWFRFAQSNSNVCMVKVLLSETKKCLRALGRRDPLRSETSCETHASLDPALKDFLDRVIIPALVREFTKTGPNGFLTAHALLDLCPRFHLQIDA